MLLLGHFGFGPTSISRCLGPEAFAHVSCSYTGLVAGLAMALPLVPCVAMRCVPPSPSVAPFTPRVSFSWLQERPCCASFQTWRNDLDRHRVRASMK